MQLGLVAASDDGERVDLLILAVALVVIGIEVADKRAFHNGFHRVVSFQAGLGRQEREAPQAFRFKSAHGSAGKPAQFKPGIGF